MNTSVMRQNFVKGLAQAVFKMDDLDKFFKAITQMLVEVFGVAWASLYLFDEESGQYSLKAVSQRSAEVAPNRRVDTKEDAAPWMKQRQKILSQRLLDELGTQMAPELRDELNKSDTFASMPLFAGERLIGVLNLGAKIDNELFGEEDLDVLCELAELVAPLISQAVYYHHLSAQTRHHRHILDNLVSGIVAVDPEDKITVFNRAAERILSLRVDAVLGKDVRILQANLANLLLDTLHKGKSYRREELYVLPENTLVGVSTAQFYNAKGGLLGACMVFSNLAEIKKKEQALRQQNLDTYWSNVANSLAHEVKNSIVATKVFTELFPQKYTDAEFRWSLYSTLKRDMEKLDNFTERVLGFAQVQEMMMQPCQISKVVDAALNSVLQDKDLGKITLEKRYGQNLSPISGDYHQLKQAFAQIISNALEAMGQEGKLSVSIEQESGPEMLIYNLPQTVTELPAGDIIVVKITDTGCGILPQDMPQLFDPFFTTKEARAGLGLAFARKIIQRHRGIISAESASGEGTTFWVLIPALPEK